MLLVWAAYMIPAATVIAVDPYDLYPWGVRIKPATRHDLHHAHRLLGIATGDPEADTILVGSSTSMRLRVDDIRALIPGARVVWNLSYMGVTGRDRQIVLGRIAERSRARNILVMLDYVLASSSDRPSGGFPIEQYDDDLANDLRVVDVRTLRETRDALLRNSPFPDRPAADRALQAFLARSGSSSFYRPEILASIDRALREQRSTIDAGLDKPCSAFPLLPRFEATIRRLAARGRRVYLIAPVYSPSFHYQHHADGTDVALRMGDQLAMRRCVVNALGDTANVAISALDSDTTLTNDLSNFYDPAHLVGRANFRRQLAAATDPWYRLTAANIDAYVDRYRRNVRNYCPRGFPKGC